MYEMLFIYSPSGGRVRRNVMVQHGNLLSS